MAHILRDSRSRTIGREHAAVMVEVGKNAKLVVQDKGVQVLKSDTLIAKLPSNYIVVGWDGKGIGALNEFYITVETINPYHYVLDFGKDI